MSERLVPYLTNFLRTRAPLHVNTAFFPLHLLALDKLDREQKLPGEYSLSKAAIQPSVKEVLQHAFRFNERNDPSSLTAAAWDVPQDVFQYLSEADFRTLVEVLLKARGQEIDYRVAIDDCMRPLGQQDFYNIQPDEVAELVIRLAGVTSTDSVYCPFEGGYRLAEHSNRITQDVYLEVHRASPLPALMNVLLDGSIQARFSNPILNPGWVEEGKLRVFDVSMANPPFNVRYQEDMFYDPFHRFPERTYYGEVLHVRHMQAQTKRRAVVVVPNSVLSRTTAGERQFKEHLLQAGQLEAVIGLPPALLTTTSIPFSILVLNNARRSDTVLFVDASSEHFFDDKRGRGSLGAGRRTLRHIDEIVHIFEQRVDGPYSRLLTRQECDENEYNIDPRRYVASQTQTKLEKLLKQEPLVALAELVEILRSQYLKEEGEGEADADVEAAEVSVSDIGEDGYIQQPKKSTALSKAQFEKVRPLVLQPNDILLAVKGAVGKVGLVPPEVNGVWLANQSFQVLRLRPNPHVSDPVVLFRYLTSPAGQALIVTRTGGATVRMLQTRDVKTLPVIVPPIEEQEIIVREHQRIVELYAEVARLQAEAKELAEMRWSLG